MLIGYARTSTTEQLAGFAAQERDLGAVGCTKIFKEHVSSVAKRPQLEAALDYIREGDTLVVTKLDRLARSIKDLWSIIECLKRKDAALRILNLGIDTSTATGTLILTVLGGIAQFERELLLERQREGIVKAKADGKYKGRKATARVHKAAIVSMRAEGLGVTAIAEKLDGAVSIPSIYRLLNEKG